MKNSSLIYG